MDGCHSESRFLCSQEEIPPTSSVPSTATSGSFSAAVTFSRSPLKAAQTRSASQHSTVILRRNTRAIQHITVLVGGHDAVSPASAQWDRDNSSGPKIGRFSSVKGLRWSPEGAREEK